MIVYLNGQFIPADDAKISVFDQGFLYGDGIYESLRSLGDHLYNFKAHFARLKQSAEALNYKIDFTEDALAKILLDLRKKNNLKHAYYRVTISRGNGEIGYERAIPDHLTVLILAKEFQGFSEEVYTKGIGVVVAETRRNAPEAINPKIKSISNLNSLLGKLEAKANGVLEVIMLNNKNHICEGSASNIFWTKENWVFTPDVSTGLLEGVTRQGIIRLCEKNLNKRVITGEYKLQDLKFADEVFITSTSLEVMPVVKVNDFIINQGQVGGLCRRLRHELHQDMKLK